MGLARPEIWGWLLLYGAGSDESTCIPPYCRAAISCGDRGRDLRLSFCRRFWNHIWGASPVSYAHGGARKTPIERVGRAGSSVGAHGTLNSYLDLFLVEGHALHNVQTRCLVRLRVGVVCCLEDCLVLCTGARRELVSNDPSPTVSARSRVVCATYAVLFLLPLGCRSDELLWKDESASTLSLVSSICTAESAVL